MSGEISFTKSSGNVYADLGFTDPDTELAKAKLAHQISRIIAGNGWTQAEAAKALGVDQPKVSKIVRGRLRDFSTERLIQYLILLNHDVEIIVAPNHSDQRAARLAVLSDE